MCFNVIFRFGIPAKLISADSIQVRLWLRLGFLVSGREGTIYQTPNNFCDPCAAMCAVLKVAIVEKWDKKVTFSVIDLSHYGEKHGENHIYTRQILTTQRQGSGENYKEIIHSEAVIAPSCNWRTSGDGWWAQLAVTAYGAVISALPHIRIESRMLPDLYDAIRTEVNNVIAMVKHTSITSLTWQHNCQYIHEVNWRTAIEEMGGKDGDTAYSLARQWSEYALASPPTLGPLIDCPVWWFSNQSDRTLLPKHDDMLLFIQHNLPLIKYFY